MKPWMIALIAALAVMVAVAGIGGYLVGRRAGRASATATRQQFLAERMGSQATTGQGFPSGMRFAGALGNGGAGTMGTVKSVEGDTIVVTTRNGDVTVQLAEGTTVRKLADGAIEDVQPGLQILVTGEADASGNVTASSIQLVPAVPVTP